MPRHAPGDIFNICFVGHGDSGKTTLADAILHTSGAVSRRGSVKEKTSVFDYDDLEREKQHSIDSSVAHLEWNGKRVNVIDTPGYPDFAGDAIAGIVAADTAVVCVNAHNGVQVNTRRTWEVAESLGRARMICVTKCDLHDTDLDGVLAGIREWFGDRCIPIQLPDGFGPSFAGTRSLFKTKGEGSEQGKAFYESLIEASVEADDDVMTRYLEGEEIEEEVIAAVFKKAVKEGLVVPIVFTSMEKDIGAKELLDTVVDAMPSAAEAKRVLYDDPKGEGEGEILEVSPEGPFYAQVFKIIVDKHVGKISFIRIVTGQVTHGMAFMNAAKSRKEKIGQIMEPMGKEMTGIEDASAGDIVALTKIDTLEIGDTISSEEKPKFLAPIPLPQPMAQLALRPASRADEAKISESLRKLAEESPTFTVHRDPSTNELLASAASQLQLDVMLKRLKDRYGIEVETSPARVPYRECITIPAEGHYRHKKQTGGRGQFGEVFLKVMPCDPGTGLQFDWDIVGGAIPSNFSGAIEKGIREKMAQGVIAGYPILDIHVSVYDGKFHDVDSSEAAFKIAGGRAFAEAVKKAKPVLLEPMVVAEIVVPSANMGDISGDLNTRRGRILGMEAKGPFQIIKAICPKAEMADYPRVLTSLTSGEGSFTYEDADYEQVPANVQQQIMAEFKPSEDED